MHGLPSGSLCLGKALCYSSFPGTSSSSYPNQLRTSKDPDTSHTDHCVSPVLGCKEKAEETLRSVAQKRNPCQAYRLTAAPKHLWGGLTVMFWGPASMVVRHWQAQFFWYVWGKEETKTWVRNMGKCICPESGWGNRVAPRNSISFWCLIGFVHDALKLNTNLFLIEWVF